MQQLVGTRGAHVVGRESELAVLGRFLEGEGDAPALVLTGGPGLGKTTLWEATVDEARRRGLRVLSSRASGAEAKLSFTALIDLLDGVEGEELAAIPRPQLSALEVALLRAEPAGTAPESRAIALGVFNGLRALAARGRLLVAVDDLQWLDPPSSEALSFAARRLEDRSVAFLLARRPGRPSALERAFAPARLERLDVGPLSLGAIRSMLSERFGLTLPRQVLRQLVESTMGNPLFALEVGRSLLAEPALEPGTELPVPDAIEDLLGTRVARLAPETRRLLLAVALSADLRRSQLEAISDPDAVEGAADAGLLVFDGDRVRASHPLVAAAARKHSRPSSRRELHLVLAGVVGDEELQARHLALATYHPNSKLAGIVSAAAATASARGARQEAVELAEHALRLTPSTAGERSDRLLTLGRYLADAGDPPRLTQVLAPELDSLPPGAPRVRACILLIDGVLESGDDVRRYIDRALAESRGEPALRAAVLAESASDTAVTRVERIREAEARALEALEAAEGADADVTRSALHSLAWARSLRGCSITDLCERFEAVSEAPYYLVGSPQRVAGQRLVWRGEVDEARALLTHLLSLADERGEAMSYALQRLHLCELELRVGNWDTAARLLDEWAESLEREALPWPMYPRCRALLAAGRGRPAEAERWAAEAIESGEAAGVAWDALEALRARGIAALVEGSHGRAAESLQKVWEHTRREGVEEPGAFPAAPDLVEALVESGDLGQATSVTRLLRTLATELQHPWGLTTAARCDALVRLAATHDETALVDLAAAASAYATLGLRFDQARTLLLLGRAERRLRKWGAARRSLERAVAAFEAIGSPGWAEHTRVQLTRISGRRPRAEGELTPTEQRVAALASDGLSNKEIAGTLFVTVPTVERHLSHVYAKLGVRSRGQLARVLATGD